MVLKGLSLVHNARVDFVSYIPPRTEKECLCSVLLYALEISKQNILQEEGHAVLNVSGNDLR